MASDSWIVAEQMVQAEECIAAGAYISRDPLETSALLSADFAKFFVVILFLGLIILGAAGVSI
jgi:hypothetical protein